MEEVINVLSHIAGDLTKLKSNPVVIKEGTEFKIEIQFKVSFCFNFCTCA